jgi:two-component system, OmpR family, response regulator VicR
LTKILVVEDDRSLRDALAYNLRREEYTPVVAEDAPTAVMVARREKPDLVLLDLMLPGGSGFDVCRDIRAFSSAPIIMLTARGEDIDRVLGLEIGADDYVTKPFSLRELLARVKANLRRVALDSGEDVDEVLEQDGVSIHVPGRRVAANGRAVLFQPKEFDLLVYLMRHPGTVLTRPRLLSNVWGHEFVGERTVDVHVRRVRAKLEAAGATDVIRTVHGVGYVLDPTPREAVVDGA